MAKSGGGKDRPRWKTVLKRVLITIVVVVAVLAVLIYLGIKFGYIGGMTIYV
ncbi:MAG: hypothetical protein ACOX69_10620 [Coriobacteriales bacterium]|jgi:hypothetical protein